MSKIFYWYASCKPEGTSNYVFNVTYDHFLAIRCIEIIFTSKHSFFIWNTKWKETDAWKKRQKQSFSSFYPIWRILNLDQRNLIDVIMSIFLIIMRGMLFKRFEMCIGNQCNFNLKSVAGLMHFLRTFEIKF